MIPLIDRIAAFVYNKVNGWLLGLAFVLYSGFALIVMRSGAEKIELLAGHPVEILDLQWHFTPEKADMILRNYTPEARQAAAYFNATADSIYPVLYTFLLIVLLGLIYRPDLKEHPAWCYVPLLPFLVMFFDYAENICIIHLLRNYPDYTHVVAVAGGWFTSFKWFSVLLIILLVLSGLHRRIFVKKLKG